MLRHAFQRGGAKFKIEGVSLFLAVLDWTDRVNTHFSRRNKTQQGVLHVTGKGASTQDSWLLGLLFFSCRFTTVKR